MTECLFSPKKTLLEKGILSYEKKTGKRGFRVYPSWDTAENQQAQKTQKWQIEYFLEFSGDRELMLKKVALLLGL
ncbi:MepB family protein [Chryseobacterium pennipullorum]|uniref:MepB family protein n=1 Tax=Chryseobacterium pennipullorum TaxID=2258963 RepID=UPI0021D11365|nr:MepB family protein [Chryseobacterium pennipullorum]